MCDLATREASPVPNLSSAYLDRSISGQIQLILEFAQDLMILDMS